MQFSNKYYSLIKNENQYQSKPRTIRNPEYSKNKKTFPQEHSILLHSEYYVPTDKGYSQRVHSGKAKAHLSEPLSSPKWATTRRGVPPPHQEMERLSPMSKWSPNDRVETNTEPESPKGNNGRTVLGLRERGLFAIEVLTSLEWSECQRGKRDKGGPIFYYSRDLLLVISVKNSTMEGMVFLLAKRNNNTKF